MARLILPAVILLATVVLGGDYFFNSARDEVSVNRSIQIKGVFLLVDEEAMLGRLKQLSADNKDRQDFLNKVRFMLDNEPYVLSSSIRHSWPDEVVIEIDEVTPVAIVNGRKLLLENCRVVDVNPAELHVQIIAFDTSDGKLDQSQCRRIVEVIPKLGSIPSSHITMLKNGDYILNVNASRLVVAASDIRNATGKVKRMTDLIRMKKINASYIDMRYISGAAIRQVAEL